MSKHTPGPWKALEGSRGWQIHTDNTAAKHNHWIANIKCESCPAHEDANARLIAAAPELLQALKELLEMTDDPENDADPEESVFTFARTIIAKAEGRS